MYKAEKTNISYTQSIHKVAWTSDRHVQETQEVYMQNCRDVTLVCVYIKKSVPQWDVPVLKLIIFL